MSDFSLDTVIIGAGVVGLTIGEKLSSIGKEILILEAEDDFGKITSSRNSGVIHAGIYYNEKSLKSKLCVRGNILLYNYCKKNHIEHINTKKILVASTEKQISVIDKIKYQAEKNGVRNIEKITKKKVNDLENLIFCEEALLVPSSGIIDAISFMRSLVGKIEDNQGMISYNSKLKKVELKNNEFILHIDDSDNTIVKCKQLINSAGLFASQVATKFDFLNKNFIPTTYFAKGNYFSVSKNLGIKHLIYPIPEGFGLGIHLTLELDCTCKFGPDVEWTDSPYYYSVNVEKKEKFVKEILKYIPKFNGDLLKPSYAGIRPIMNKKDQSMRDFIIEGSEIHNVSNLINLYGIESPGLTSSLAIAEHITSLLE